VGGHRSRRGGDVVAGGTVERCKLGQEGEELLPMVGLQAHRVAPKAELLEGREVH